MENNNNRNKYVSWILFMWMTGIAITLSVVSYGYLYTQTQNAVQQVQANTLMIGRLEERLNGILTTVIEIKDIIKER